MNLNIRQEQPEDYQTTEQVVKSAFSTVEFSDKQEHVLVDRIRKSDAFIPELSLVAFNQENEMVGHILLSKIQITDGPKSVESLALAPVSVAPEYHRKGIGSQLIYAAIEKAKQLDHHSIIVLGHPTYYPKFGFKSAFLWKIRAPFDVPDEVFMGLELTENALEHVQGVVQYSKAFE
ncbi:GNAT family N-acetyltransferase [Mesobacillus maritimus]|uniref:N-acetyltransferase n=1 Tax=Mesobacillus maritimus TaxID=1643336 RepID=A0ABS7K082_9BACI|nr:N-acetyltransferase [Mesobacillus maritimus]MBY0095664.1 N-acetyltransferase [Mesobacillus maritimus]